MFSRTVLSLLCVAGFCATAQAAGDCDVCSLSASATATASAARDHAPSKFLAKALDGRKSKLGEEHPTTIATANALAVLYRVEGRYVEAEALYLNSLAACQRTLGDSHPLTIGTMKGLAALYKAEGRLAEAALLTKRAADTKEYSY
jgi:hypothetical protein